MARYAAGLMAALRLSQHRHALPPSSRHSRRRNVARPLPRRRPDRRGDAHIFDVRHGSRPSTSGRARLRNDPLPRPVVTPPPISTTPPGTLAATVISRNTLAQSNPCQAENSGGSCNYSGSKGAKVASGRWSGGILIGNKLVMFSGGGRLQRSRNGVRHSERQMGAGDASDDVSAASRLHEGPNIRRRVWGCYCRRRQSTEASV